MTGHGIFITIYAHVGLSVAATHFGMNRVVTQIMYHTMEDNFIVDSEHE